MTTAATSHRSQRWREFPPVDDPVTITEREVGVTFMRTHDRCDRSAYLDLRHEGGPASAELNRGGAFHEFAAKAIRHLIETDEKELTPEVAKDLLIEVFDENPDVTVPAAERDALRQMVYHFALALTVEPEQVIAVEQALELRLGEWTLRGRPDYITSPYFGRLDITDWKTSFAMPTAEEWEGDYQTSLYALLAAFGTTADGLQIGRDVEEFGLYLRFPRYLRDDELAKKHTLVRRDYLTDLRLDLEHQLRRLERSLESGRWPATPGSHCAECVSPAECPLPRHLRPDSQMTLGSIEDAQKLAEWWEVERARVARAKTRLKAWADQHGRRSIPIGTDLELAFEHRLKSVHLDREQLAAEIEGAIEYGLPFVADRIRAKTEATEFVRRRVK